MAKSPGQRGAAHEVGDHAAAHVVGGRHHRDGLHRHVHAELLDGGVDVGEVLEQERLGQVRHVEEGAVVAAPLDLGVDGAGHDVARGQLLARVVAGHEGLAGGVAQDAALAAQRLGDEEALGLGVEERGGVELEELHVGDGRSGPPRHGHAVAGPDVRAGGVEVDLAGAAGGQHRDPRRDGGDGPAGAGEDVGAHRAVGAAQPQLAAGDEIDRHGVLDDADAPGVAGGQQGPLHLAAGGVLGVGDAAARVAPLAGEVEAGAVVVELDAQREEPADPLRPLPHRHLDGLAVAQAGARHQRVLDVQLELVVEPEDAGDAPLRVLGGALRPLPLGEDQHRAVAGDLEGEAEAGDAAAQDQEVDVLAGGERAHAADLARGGLGKLSGPGRPCYVPGSWGGPPPSPRS